MTYQIRMDGVSEPVDADTLNAAITRAEHWLREGDWDTTNGTVWATGYLVEIDDEDEEIRHRIRVTIDPEEPPCSDADGHDWQAPVKLVGGCKENPGVYGHGGGVTMREVCMRCGCGKLIDTWAQDPETGEQGLRSVTYTPDQYQEAI